MPEHIKAGRSGKQCIKPEKEVVCDWDRSRKTAGENYGALIFKDTYEFSYDMHGLSGKRILNNCELEEK